MLIRTEPLTRRRVLRGMLNGGAVAVALPLLDCFLNESGTAFASTNAPLPTRFGTWFWGLGMNKTAFIPKIVGPDFDLPDEIASLQDIKQHLNLLRASPFRRTATRICATTRLGSAALRRDAERPQRSAR